MRVRALVAVLALPLALIACASERDVVVGADYSPVTSSGVAERVLHPGAPCTGGRAVQARCGSDDGGLAQPPVPRRDIPGMQDGVTESELGSP